TAAAWGACFSDSICSRSSLRLWAGAAIERVVTHKPYSNDAFRNLAFGRTPRLRRFGGFATFSLWRSHPSFARRGMAFERHSSSFIHTLIDRAYNRIGVRFAGPLPWGISGQNSVQIS